MGAGHAHRLYVERDSVVHGLPPQVKLVAKYVDGTIVPHPAIAERFLRVPKASFVYAVSM